MKQIQIIILGTYLMSCIKKTLPVKRLSHAFCFTMIIVLLSGCGGGDGNNDPCAGVSCAAYFEALSISVVDQNGNPITDVNITVKIKTTQEVLDIKQDIFFTSQGLYVVFNDSFVNRITTDAAGETLTITGNSQGRNFTVEIVVKRPCCHFQKVSGPSSVTL